MTSTGIMTHWAMLDVASAAQGSRIAFDFIPLQSANLPTQGDDAQPPAQDSGSP
jgi:hypothetical protein